MKLWLVAGALVLAGCSENIKEHADLGCPNPEVREAQANVRALRSLPQGGNPKKVLRELRNMTQRAPLIGPAGEVWEVRFYPAGVPSCAHLWPRVGMVPVVVDEQKSIRAVGRTELGRLKEMGWQMRGMAWDWGQYDYAYLPEEPALRSGFFNF